MNLNTVFGRPSFGADNSNVSNGKFKAADAFLNISVPAQTESGRVKLGKGIALHLDNVIDQELIEMRNKADKAGKLPEFYEWLKSQLILEIRSAEKTGGPGLSNKPDFLV